jgi:hypothetical protein
MNLLRRLYRRLPHPPSTNYNLQHLATISLSLSAPYIAIMNANLQHAAHTDN